MRRFWAEEREREVCKEDTGSAGFGEGETAVFADAAAGLRRGG